MLIRFTLAAGQTTEYTEENDFFRVLEGTGEMSLIFYFNGKEVSRADKVKEGYAEKFLTERYNRVVIKNEAAFEQSIQVVGRLGHEVEYNKTPVGDVNVKNTGGMFAQGTKTVTTGPVVLSEAASRRYLLIQNNDEGQTIFVSVGDSVASIGNGIKLSAGDSIEFQGYVPTGEITAISENATTSKILVVEG